MTIQFPATIANDVFEELRALVVSAERYFSYDDRRISDLLEKTNKLQRSDAQEAFRARAVVHMLCGDRDNSITQIKKAEALGFNRAVYATKCIVLINLGYFSEAQAAFKVSGDATSGFFGTVLDSAINSGALVAYERQLCIAEKMQLDLDVAWGKRIRNAIEILSESGVTDIDLGRYLDVVGEIMREKKMFFLEPRIDFFVWTKDEADQFVHMSFRLPVDARTAEQLDTDLVTRILDRFGSLPEPLSITIKSGLPSHGRIAERSSATGSTAR